MNVSCAACRAVFRVDPERVPAAGVTARCTRCGSGIALTTDQRSDDWFSDDWYADEAAMLGRPPLSRALLESDAAAAPEIETPVRSWAQERPVAPVPASAPQPLREPVRQTAPEPVRHHPFLRVDPRVRAQRLARALVSDLIAYHPGRREAATAAGTLRLAFREEIARSYAVYAAEVGREVAEGTTYFQEALNEMLAQGRALF